ncbi:hypothetical protein SAMN04515617_12267 [Collimonas sp. OK242]|nr:hypothetical protein SAMN04515617_12267 [Collimonas sp. OK242]
MLAFVAIFLHFYLFIETVSLYIHFECGNILSLKAHMREDRRGGFFRLAQICNTFLAADDSGKFTVSQH